MTQEISACSRRSSRRSSPICRRIGTLHPALQVAAFQPGRAGGVRHQLRGQFARRQRRIELLEQLVAAGVDPARMMPGHGHLRADRHGAAHRARRETRLRRRADASPFTTRAYRMRASFEATHRSSSASGTPGCESTCTHPWLHRSASRRLIERLQGLPGNHRRAQGFLGTGTTPRRCWTASPARLRRVRGRRIVSAREPAQRGRAASGGSQREPGAIQVCMRTGRWRCRCPEQALNVVGPRSRSIR